MWSTPAALARIGLSFQCWFRRVRNYVACLGAEPSGPQDRVARNVTFAQPVQGQFPSLCVSGGTLRVFLGPASALSVKSTLQARIRNRRSASHKVKPLSCSIACSIDNPDFWRELFRMGLRAPPRGVSRRSRFTYLKHNQPKDCKCLRLTPFPATSLQD